MKKSPYYDYPSFTVEEAVILSLGCKFGFDSIQQLKKKSDDFREIYLFGKDDQNKEEKKTTQRKYGKPLIRLSKLLKQVEHRIITLQRKIEVGEYDLIANKILKHDVRHWLRSIGENEIEKLFNDGDENKTTSSQNSVWLSQFMARIDKVMPEVIKGMRKNNANKETLKQLFKVKGFNDREAEFAKNIVQEKFLPPKI